MKDGDSDDDVLCLMLGNSIQLIYTTVCLMAFDGM